MFSLQIENTALQYNNSQGLLTTFMLAPLLFLKNKVPDAQMEDIDDII